MLLVASALLSHTEGELPAPRSPTSTVPLVDLEPRTSWAPKVADPQNWVLFRHSCESHLGEREVTLFLDGTIRLRLEDPEGEETNSGSLKPENVARTYSTLKSIQTAIGDQDQKNWSRFTQPGGITGELLRRCEIYLNLPDLAPEIFHFTTMEGGPLWLEQLRLLSEELGDRTVKQIYRGLPAAYRPKFGDLLRRRDGAVFRFVGMTSDKKAWMVEQVGQPTTTYYSAEEISQVFIGLVDAKLR